MSTGGLAPALAHVLRERALEVIGLEWGTLARLLGRLRRLTPASPARTVALKSLANADTAQLVAGGDLVALWKRIRAVWLGGAPSRAEAKS